MANPRNATTQRGGQRFYTWRGENYWSVTTLLKGGLPMGYGLQKWMKAATALGSIQEADVIELMLKKCETPDVCQKTSDYKAVCSECMRIIEWLMQRPYTLTQKAADIGSAVHEAIEALIKGQPYPPWSHEIAPRMAQFERFVAEWQPVFEMSEASVYNRTQRYAGTLDAIMLIGDDMPPSEFPATRLIMDTKSGKGIYPEVALQLAMYRHAEFIGLPDGSEAPMPQVDGACALHLTDDFYELLDVDTSEDVFRFALHARENYRWSTEASKSVIRGPLRRDVDPGVAAVGQMLLESRTDEVKDMAKGLTD